jgi:hypothetical protein
LFGFPSTANIQKQIEAEDSSAEEEEELLQ